MKSYQSLKTAILFYVISLTILLFLYYVLYFSNVHKAQQQQSVTLFNHIHQDFYTILLSSKDTEQDLNSAYVDALNKLAKEPHLKDWDYTIRLDQKSHSHPTNTIRHYDKEQSHLFGPPSINFFDKTKSGYTIDKKRLIGWMPLKNQYYLYIDVLHQPKNFDTTSYKFWLPLIMFFFLNFLAILFLFSRLRLWKKTISYANDMSMPLARTQVSLYTPLTFNEIPSNDFQMLANALSRSNYKLYRRYRYLSNLKNRFDKLVEHSPLPMASVLRNGQIIFVNTKFKVFFMTGFEDDSQIHITDLVTGIDKKEQLVLNTLSELQVARQLNVTQLSNNKIIQLNLNPWFSEHGQVQGFSAIFSDITHLSHQIDDANHVIQKQQHTVSSFEKLWSVMGHELRTPLSGIIGMIDLIDNKNFTSEQKETFSTIKQTSHSMINMLNDMLDIAKLDAGKLELSIERIDILSLCRQVCELMVGNARRQNIELLYFFEPNFPRYIYVDESRLRQILMNLISNAIKFTQKGYVALFVSIGQKPAESTYTLAENESWVDLKVVDTGIGISSEEQQKLFSFFNQANSGISKQFGGTGLGLAISKNFTHMMKGNLVLNSEVNEGSTFTVSLPVKTSTQRIYQFKTDLITKVGLISITNQQPSKKHLQNTFRYLNIPTVMRVGLTKQTVADIKRWLKAPLFDDITPILLIEHETITDNNLDLLEQLFTDSGRLSKILISMTPERNIPTELLNKFNGYISKPIDIVLLVSEVMRLNELKNSHSSGYYHTSKLQSSFNQFLSATNTNITSTLKEAQSSQISSIQPINQTKETETQNGDTVSEQDIPQIILAEDNPVNLKIATKLVKKLGYEVLCASNGQEAIDLLSKHPDKIELILMDCHMPVMDGWTATKKIREASNDVTIVALTANQGAEDKQKCLDAGMDDFLSKPLQKDILKTILDMYL